MLLKVLGLTLRKPARAWMMVRMAGWIVILSGLVKICPLPTALRLVSTSTRGKQTENSADELSTAIDSILSLDFFVLKPSCWKRATVLHRYLALRGVSTTIVFGLRREADGELKGHAWLEREGRPVFESSPPIYKVTYTFPSSQRFDGELALMAGPED
jgi:hypothetical protein